MQVSYSRIREEIGYDLGMGRDPDTDWDSDEEEDVDRFIRTGLDMYAHPPIIPAFGARAHQWSWLRPIWRMTTATGQRRYTLPLDFEQFTGDIFYDGEQDEYGPIQQTNPGRLLQLYQQDDDNNYPCLYAIEPLATEGTVEQRMQLVLHPTPDGSYKLVTQYQIGIRMLSTDNPYPPGGPEHGEGWLAACLAAAEAKANGERGIRYQQFMDCIMRDISRDLGKQPKLGGYVGNGKNYDLRSRHNARRALDLQSGYTTYNGGTEL